MRIIKKYPNRRLYDTEISRYITLDDVRKLVVNGIDIRVTDVKTEEDLTRNVLLQIIAEQEHEGKPIFNTPMLTQLVRFYGNSYQSAFSEYLQKSLEMFAAHQQSVQKNFQQTDQQPFCRDNERDDGAEHGSLAATSEQFFPSGGVYQYRLGQKGIKKIGDR